MTLLMSNMAAAVNKTELSAQTGKCCTNTLRRRVQIIVPAAPIFVSMFFRPEVPIGDVMRYLMYARSYKNHKKARDHFKKSRETSVNGCFILIMRQRKQYVPTKWRSADLYERQ